MSHSLVSGKVLQNLTAFHFVQHYGPTKLPEFRQWSQAATWLNSGIGLPNENFRKKIIFFENKKTTLVGWSKK
ncbi:hypothetical protein Q3O59_04665 [Alkalimonas delamerensis]|uniref:Uncharacterized protein n=1 Tax=Alkalimonas delamerensis TaxID=265981 RepID=A0ABT9GMX1_9GAMM|nr:hypothetical protein [Alkalimonas delamerensis]MDP4528322.1 hypothetical protein [Alkalimonas delamerensis]